MEDFDIEIISEKRIDKTPIQLPLNFLVIGDVQNDDVKVYIKQSVFKELENYASSDTAHELGTILVGDYSEELGKIHVIISDYIIAKYTDASASTLTFTHDTWDYIHSEHEAKYKDKKIVGWQHTHPGYGIFLSNYDMFIQENFFNIPFQVAYVIDPIQHLRGFFQWKNGKVEKLAGYYIYDDLGVAIKVEQPKPRIDHQKELVDSSKPKSQMVQMAFMGIMSILIMILLINNISLSRKVESQSKSQRSLEEQIISQNATLEDYADKIDEMMESSIIDNPEAKDEENVISTDKSNNTEVEDIIPEDNSSFTGIATFQTYTVKEDDNLEKICSENGLDYASSYRIITGMNGISDPNKIYVGQTILLPIVQ